MKSFVLRIQSFWLFPSVNVQYLVHIDALQNKSCIISKVRPAKYSDALLKWPLHRRYSLTLLLYSVRFSALGLSEVSKVFLSCGHDAEPCVDYGEPSSHSS